MSQGLKKEQRFRKREKISELSKTQSYNGVLSKRSSSYQDIVKQAIAGGYKKSTPVAVVYRASWDDEKIITGTLETY